MFLKGNLEEFASIKSRRILDSLANKALLNSFTVINRFSESRAQIWFFVGFEHYGHVNLLK